MEKLICPGLSRTGSRSLAAALEILGYKTSHWQPHRLRDVIMGHTATPNFKRFNDVDAILDLPASIFFKELLDAYKDSKIILTVREENQWFDSVWKHYQWVHQNLKDDLLSEAIVTQQIAYGTTNCNKFIYCKKFREHNESVKALGGVLIMDICNGDKWEKLCEWLNVPVPNVVFPNVSKNQSPHASDQ